MITTSPPLPKSNIKRHVIILGAGASRACCLAGDANGLKIPIIADFIETLELRPKLEAAGVYIQDENFEALYSRLSVNPKYSKLVRELEKDVFAYFSKLRLPIEPTIYDHLILSLREKDIIISFNWDPFLVQAAQRCQKLTKPPLILFLHGNVTIGYCIEHEKITLGNIGQSCRQCGKLLIDSKLLYPVTNKDYHSDPLIKSLWKTTKECLSHCFLLTIFGYGAPDTDVEAINLMKEAWGDVNDRPMEETEIIDIKLEAELVKKWGPFIHTHHYQTHQSFYESMSGIFPRRSVEMMRKQLIDAKFVDLFPIPKKATWEELEAWIKPFIKQERDLKLA